ncbi:hypothetical protein JAO29_22445 [Edaphobacter sp. HDX4]|uniref:hypothetical protein n=1 Tax=Edaphobacter sp. HDX4 TaxID=2794064 RepID=UPI002FE68343
MQVHSCCPANGRNSFPAPSKARQARDAGEWGVPTLVLFLLPKCPMCVAAYVAMFTGIGLSIEAATWLRASTLAVCVLALTALTTRLLRRYFVPG